MNKKKKICIITGTRAEYGLLYWLLKEIDINVSLELQIIATCMHLSPEFGLTYKQIENDGFSIDWKVEMLLSSDTPVGISKSMGLALIGFADAYSYLQPDVVVILGDRFELLSAASAALVARIPIAHIHGGGTTEGAIDESIRHSITKMSHIHFTTTEIYRQRVIQLGENSNNVYNFGAPGIDNINNLKLLSQKQLEGEINFKFGKKNILVTFHPVTLEKSTASEQFQNLLYVLDSLDSVKILFTKANADTDGRIINRMIDDFIKERPNKAVGFTSLGQLRYLSTIRYVDGVVGNSSSGLIEAPTFKVGTINIGDRQRGRVQADSVINCEPTVKGIELAFRELFSAQFIDSLTKVVNPYGNGGTAKKIVNVIDHYNIKKSMKKKFYDFDC